MKLLVYIVPILLTAQIKIACIGNSITSAEFLDIEERWTYKLEERLGIDYEVMNYGRSGSTVIRYPKYQYQRSWQHDAAKSYYPDILIIMLGANDSSPSTWVNDWKRFEPDYKKIISYFNRPIEKKAETKEAMQLVLTQPTPNLDKGQNDVIQEMGLIIKTIAKELGGKYVRMDNIGLVDEDYSDHAHILGSGQTKIARRFANKIMPIYLGIYGDPPIDGTEPKPLVKSCSIMG